MRFNSKIVPLEVRNKEAERLSVRFKDVKKSEIAEVHGLDVNMINQNIKGTKLISWKYAQAYAAIFNCEIKDISERLANEYMPHSPSSNITNTVTSKSKLKKVTLSELVNNKNPLQGMADKLAEVFLSLSEQNRELLQLIANKMYENDHPNDGVGSGTKPKGKKEKVNHGAD